MPPTDIMPRAEFETDFGKDTGQLKAQRLMQFDAGFVGQRDARVSHAVALSLNDGQEVLIEKPTDTAPLM